MPFEVLWRLSTRAGVAGCLLALAFALPVKAEVSGFGEEFKLCDGLPTYPDGGRVWRSPRYPAYLIQQIEPHYERHGQAAELVPSAKQVIEWFAQKLPGWHLTPAPPATVSPRYWKLQDSKSPRAIWVQEGTRPIVARYKCF